MALSDLLSSVFSRKPSTADLSAAVAAAEQAVDAAGASFHRSPSDDARALWERARLDLDLARDRLARAQADDARRAAKQAAADRAELVRQYRALEAEASTYLDAAEPLMVQAVDHVLGLVDVAQALIDAERARQARLAPMREMAPQLTLDELGLQDRFAAMRDGMIAEDVDRVAQGLPAHSSSPAEEAEREVRRAHAEVLARTHERGVALEIAAAIGRRVNDKLARERPMSAQLHRLTAWAIGGIVRAAAREITAG